MACCGQKRTILNNATTSARSRPTVQQWTVAHPVSQRQQVTSAASRRQSGGGEASPFASVWIRYQERSPILVRGNVTGNQYRFSGASPLVQVDSRDAPALLETRFFRRA